LTTSDQVKVCRARRKGTHKTNKRFLCALTQGPTEVCGVKDYGRRASPRAEKGKVEISNPIQKVGRNQSLNNPRPMGKRFDCKQSMAGGLFYHATRDLAEKIGFVRESPL